MIALGDIEPMAEHHPCVFAYRRTYEGHELIVAANFYGRTGEWKEAPDLTGFKRVIGNYAEESRPEGGVWSLRPYEASVWYR